MHGKVGEAHERHARGFTKPHIASRSMRKFRMYSCKTTTASLKLMIRFRDNPKKMTMFLFLSKIEATHILKRWPITERKLTKDSRPHSHPFNRRFQGQREHSSRHARFRNYCYCYWLDFKCEHWKGACIHRCPHSEAINETAFRSSYGSERLSNSMTIQMPSSRALVKIS